MLHQDLVKDTDRLLSVASRLLAVAKSASATYQDRFSLLEEERVWRGDDECDDMIGQYTALKNACDAAIIDAERR